jgi:hypothetical protein
MLLRLDEYAPPRAWGSQIFIRHFTNEIRPFTSRYRPSAGAQPPSVRPPSTIKALNPTTQPRSRREPLSPPSLRAQVSTARRDCGRVGIALRFRRAYSRSSSATPRAEGSSGRQVVSASALALKAIAGPQVALGRAGDGPRAFPGWEAASVALCGARGGDLRAADSPAPTPPGLQVPEVRLGGVGVLKSVKFTELCSFDSESSEKKILLIEYVFILRSSRVLDRW